MRAVTTEQVASGHAASKPRPRSARQGFRARALRRARSVGTPLASVLVIVVIWELAVTALDVPSYLLPPPTDIVAEMINSHAQLLHHSGATLLVVGGGFGTAAAVGIPLAVVLTYSKTLEQAVYPLLVAIQTVPKVAVAPLLVVWFGFGVSPKVAMAFIIAVFPVVISSVTGLKSTPVEMLQLSRSMGMSALRTFYSVRFPYALPEVFAGLKVAITLSVIGAVVAEFVGADRGLGYLIIQAHSEFRTTTVFGAVVTLAVMGMVLFALVAILERLVLPWHSSARNRQ